MAATPAPGLVSVRIEGSSNTLLPPTTVLTQAAAFHPAGDPTAAHTCPGTSAAQALEVATGGTWMGPYFASFGDYEVTSILGELHPTSPADGGFWSFWVDNAPAQVGICQQQLNPGDQILFFPDCFGPACPAGFVSPAVLGLSAPSIVQSGAAFTAGVVSYPNAGGPARTLVGATISGDGVTVGTGPGGLATLALSVAGSYLLTATAPNSVRTERLICVHNGNDGNCGTTHVAAGGSPTDQGGGSPTGVTPGGSTPTPTPTPQTPCRSNGTDGYCGSPDRTAPIARLQITEGHHYGHGKGPRALAGTATLDPSGLKSIRLRLTRQHHGVCQVFSAKKASLVSGSCEVTNAPWFAVGPPAPFSYLLKKRLPAGRYVLDIQATDGAGNVEPAQVPGRSRIVFRVE